MIDWEDLRGFAALARHGTLSGAARALGVEHATIARRVAALEAGLGLRLVDRRGRKLMLTPEGLRVADSAGRMEAEALAAERIALAARAELSGRVTLSAPPALAAARLAAPLARLVERSPGLVIEVRGEKREALLDRREADIAVRLSRPRGGDLNVVRLGAIGFRFYANPEFVARTPPEA